MLVKQYSLNIVRLPIEYRSLVALRGDSCSVARCQDYVGRPALTKNGIYQVLFPNENLRVLQKKEQVETPQRARTSSSSLDQRDACLPSNGQRKTSS